MKKNKIIFNHERCKGCLLCANACPLHLIEMDKTHTNASGYNCMKVNNPEKCVGCTMCALMCPDSVITVETEEGK